MAAAVQQGGGLFRKYGQRLDKAVREHAAADPKVGGFPSLPAPIKDGVAEIVSCGFYQYKEDSNMKKVDGSSAVGEYFWRAVGVVLEPEFIFKDGRKVFVRGLQTTQMIPVIDTKNAKGEITSMEANIERIEGHLKLLGASKEELAQGAAALESIAEAIGASAENGSPIRFKFETSQGKATEQYPDPRVWENWYGVKGLENYEPPSQGPTPGAVDNTAKPSANGKHATPATKPAAAPAQTEEPELPDDVRELAAMCETGDDRAVQKLQDMALGLGVTQAEWEATSNYGEAADLIEAAQAGGDGAGVTEEPFVPVKGGIYLYHPIDQKTKKPVKTAVEVEVTVIDKKAEVVAVKRLDNKAIIKGIKFADLSEPT